MHKEVFRMQQRDAKNTPQDTLSSCCQLPVQQALYAYSFTLYIWLPLVKGAVGFAD